MLYEFLVFRAFRALTEVFRVFSSAFLTFQTLLFLYFRPFLHKVCVSMVEIGQQPHVLEIYCLLLFRVQRVIDLGQYPMPL